MKIHSLLFLVTWFCLYSSHIKVDRNTYNNPERIHTPEFQEILDSAGVEGHILVFDFQKNSYYSNDFGRAERAFIPASTFKIPNTLMALENGIVQDANTVIQWDGVERNFSAWNQDLTLREAFHASCVPCFQWIAREAGAEKLNDFVEIVDYGKMEITAENVDDFWLLGTSRISSFQQIDFLRRYHQSELDISETTERIAKELMTVSFGNNGKLLAKTGWSVSGVGWYVGYVEKDGRLLFFATNLVIDDDEKVRVRKPVTMKALKHLGVYEELKP